MQPKKRSEWTPWTDPICLLAWVAYCLNRFVLAPQFGGTFPFLRDHFNDSLLIPAALPLLYWARFRFGLREYNRPPTWRDVMLWCAAWALIFEWAGPHFLHRSVSDWGDVAAYFIGGIIAAAWWNRAVTQNDRRHAVNANKGGRTGAAPLS